MSEAGAGGGCHKQRGQEDEPLFECGHRPGDGAYRGGGPIGRFLSVGGKAHGLGGIAYQ